MNDLPAVPTSLPGNIYGPLTPSQVFERTFTLLRKNFTLFFGITLVVIGLEIGIGLIAGIGNMWMKRSALPMSPVYMILFVAPLAILGAILIYVFTQIVQGALFYATQARLAGISTSVGQACGHAASKVGKLVGISMLVAARIFGYVLVFFCVFFLLLLFVALAFGGVRHIAGGIPFRMGQTPPMGMIVFAGMFVLVFLVMYLGLLLWLIARYALAIPAALGENLSVTDAIRRSIHLSAGSRGRIYAVVLFIGGVWIALSLISLPVQLMMTASAAARHTMTFLMVGFVTMLLALFRILFSAVLIAFMGVATTLCYYDLRVRKDRFGTPVADTSPVILPPAPGMSTETFPSA